MTPAILNIPIYRGITSDSFVFNVKDSSGNPVPLSGWSVFAKSRNGYGQPIDLEPTITNASMGQVTISLDATETASFNTGNQPWDLLFQKPTGEILGPYISGTILVNDTVTKWLILK